MSEPIRYGPRTFATKIRQCFQFMRDSVHGLIQKPEEEHIGQNRLTEIYLFESSLDDILAKYAHGSTHDVLIQLFALCTYHTVSRKKLKDLFARTSIYPELVIYWEYAVQHMLPVVSVTKKGDPAMMRFLNSEHSLPMYKPRTDAQRVATRNAYRKLLLDPSGIVTEPVSAFE